jgi:hypothetical protein
MWEEKDSNSMAMVRQEEKRQITMEVFIFISRKNVAFPSNFH